MGRNFRAEDTEEMGARSISGKLDETSLQGFLGGLLTCETGCPETLARKQIPS